MNENVGRKIRVTNPKHPHFGESGTLIGTNVQLSISMLGVMDEVEKPDGSRFFVRDGDYTLYAQ